MARIFSIALLACLALLQACSSAAQVELDPLGAAPPDFMLDVAVIVSLKRAASESPVPIPATEAHMQQSRYVLMADGSLHFGAMSDADREKNWLPLLARMLTTRQVAEIWSLAAQLGFTDPAFANPTVSVRTIHPQANEIVYVAAFTGADRSWNFVRRNAIDQSPDAAVTQLVRALAELAFASDLSEAQIRIAPKRYDFGPDPYARYRKE